MHHERRNVVLTGFMGTGKTTVGRVVAERLGYAFVDTDDVIVERHGPIPAIFATHGEPFFRELERDIASELAARDGLVIATGGRMLVDPANADVLAATGLVVCLTADVDTIVHRVASDDVATRPMLAGASDVRARISDLLAERAQAYERFVMVPTDDRMPADIADEIVGLVRG